MIELIVAGVVSGGVAVWQAVRRRGTPDPSLVQFEAEREVRRIKDQALRSMLRTQAQNTPPDDDVVDGTAVEVDRP